MSRAEVHHEGDDGVGLWRRASRMASRARWATFVYWPCRLPVHHLVRSDDTTSLFCVPSTYPLSKTTTTTFYYVLTVTVFTATQPKSPHLTSPTSTTCQNDAHSCPPMLRHRSAGRLHLAWCLLTQITPTDECIDAVCLPWSLAATCGRRAPCPEH